MTVVAAFVVGVSLRRNRRFCHAPFAALFLIGSFFKLKHTDTCEWIEMNDKFRVNEVISSEKWHNEIIKI